MQSKSFAKHHFKKRKPSAIALAVGMTLFASQHAVHAADETELLMLEEIIVTAQKREESLQDTPLSVQAVSGEALQSAGVDSLASLDQINSGFTMNDAVGFSLAYIRGVGSTNQGAGSYSSVATYIDDVYITRVNSLLFSLNSVEQVQILRGPQGALYGRNATGGAMVITTKTPLPGDEFEGRVSGTIGDYGNREYGAYFTGSLTETLAASLEVSKTDRDGYVESTTPGTDDLEANETFAVLSKLVFQPSDTVSLQLNLSRDETDGTVGQSFHQLGTSDPAGDGLPLNAPQALILGVTGGMACAAANAAPCAPADVLAYLGANPAEAGQLVAAASQVTFDNQFGYASNNNRTSFGSFSPPFYVIDSDENQGRQGGFNYTEDTRASFQATINFETFDLVSITSATDSFYEAATDVLAATPGSVTSAFAGVTVPGVGVLGDNLGFSAVFDSNSQSQEIRLVSTDSSVEWLGGLYYFHDEGDTLITGDILGASLQQANNAFEVDSWSAFGQVKFTFADVIGLTLGARWTDETYELQDNIPTGDSTVLPGIVNQAFWNSVLSPSDPLTYPGLESETDFSKLTGGAILDWAINDNAMVYASLNTGFKSGNLNANNPLSGGVDEEEITAYEVGFKSDLASGRIRLNGAAFFYDYDNIHIQVINSNTGATILLNGSKAELLGAEMEMVALLTEGLTFNAGFTLIDSEYKDNVFVDTATTLDIKGKSLAGAADTAVTLGLEYIVDLPEAELIFNGNALLSGGYFFDPENRVGTGGANDDAYTTINANIMYRTDAWDVSLWVNNLTDEEYYRGGVVANGALESVIQGAPRYYGLTVGLNL